MKLTTFHQHHQLVAHPQNVPTNGNYNGSTNYQTVQININTNQQQQHYMIPQTHHHHQQQQSQQIHQQYQIPTNYVANNVFKMNQSPPKVPFVPQQKQQSQQQQQRSSAIWHQQYTSSPTRNDFNGNSPESG
jgi:hypothetical protein